MARSQFDQGRFQELEPIAVIDIGSNSVRLVVYEGAVRAPFPLFNEKLHCGLGRALTRDGDLNEESVARALAALRRYKAICRTLQAKNIMAIATAAVRDARDGDAFIARAEDILGTNIQVLTGEREAELAANGIRMGIADPDGVCGDLGGGSLELINIGGKLVDEAVSLPLGGLRLMDRAKRDKAAATPLIEKDLSDVSWLSKGRGRPFYAIGGTWRALAKMHMHATEAPLRVMHGYRVKRSEMSAFSAHVAWPGDTTRWPNMKKAPKARRETMPYGALVLHQLLEQMRPSEVIFSIFGIREGLLYSFLSPVQRERDPLLSFCQDFARLRSRSYEHAVELCDWTDRLFRAANVAEDDAQRRLRHAACLLSDVEWRSQPDHRGELSLYGLSHAPATGLDHDDRMFIALTVYFRHAGRGDMRGNEPSGYIRKAVSEPILERAKLVAAALRTAHMLSIGMPGIMEDIAVRVDDGVLTLSVPQAFAEFDGERLRARFGAFTDQLNLKPRIEFA